MDAANAVRAYLARNPKTELSLLFLGIGGVGKLSFILRLFNPSFTPSPHFDPTLEVPLEGMRISIYDNTVKMHFVRCDIGTEFSHTEVFKKWVGEFDACVLTYAPTSRASFRLMRAFWDEVKPTCVLVLASKVDLPKERWEVTNEEGREFARSLGAAFGVASAMTGQGCGLEDVVLMATTVLARKIEDEENQRAAENPHRGSIVSRIVKQFKSPRKSRAPEEGPSRRDYTLL